MKKTFFTKSVSILLVLGLIIAMTVPVGAAKPGTPTPVPLTLAPSETDISVAAGETAYCTLKATGTNVSQIVWSAAPTAPTSSELTYPVLVLVSQAYNRKTATASAIYSFVSHASGAYAYTITGSVGDSDAEASVTFAVAAASNTVPVASSQTVFTNEDTSLDITLSGSDTDGDALSYSVSNIPSHGALSGIAPDLTYTPEVNFNGTDSFTFTVNDGTSTSAPATVSITVSPINDAPVAANDTASGIVGTPISLDVLANDTDVDGDMLSITSFANTSGATVVLVGETNLFNVTATVAGTYAFTYVATDGTASSNAATVTVTFTEALPDELVYVALGDSIPYGRYNTSLFNYLFGGTDTNSYIEQFSDTQQVLPENFHDLSVSGWNSIDVLNQLNDATAAALIGEADVITLCIGGNDIMDAAPRTLSGLDKYHVDFTAANLGRTNFEANWSRIVDGIQELNPDVTLIVMTIYNPYRATDTYNANIDPYFENTSVDKYGLNYLIRNTETLYGEQLSQVRGQSVPEGYDFDYRVADIHAAFNASPIKDSLTGFYSSFCDPHPNQKGHDLIFAEHNKVYGTN